MEKFAKFKKDVEPLDEGLVVWKKNEVYLILDETDLCYAIHNFEMPQTKLWIDKKCEGNLFDIIVK